VDLGSDRALRVGRSPARDPDPHRPSAGQHRAHHRDRAHHPGVRHAFVTASLPLFDEFRS
jgi:hypothetical protein